MGIKSWSDEVAGLAVDALPDAGLVRRGDFDRAVGFVAEEIFVRLVLGDYPPAGAPIRGQLPPES